MFAVVTAMVHLNSYLDEDDIVDQEMLEAGSENEEASHSTAVS